MLPSGHGSGLDGGVAGDDIWINGRRDAMVDAVVVQHSDGGHQTARLLGRVQQSAAGLVQAPETRFQQAEELSQVKIFNTHQAAICLLSFLPRTCVADRSNAR